MMSALFDMVNAASKVSAGVTQRVLLRCIADPTQTR
jgi:hypothetical protein